MTVRNQTACEAPAGDPLTVFAEEYAASRGILEGELLMPVQAGEIPRVRFEASRVAAPRPPSGGRSDEDLSAALCRAAEAFLRDVGLVVHADRVLSAGWGAIGLLIENRRFTAINLRLHLKTREVGLATARR